MISSKLGNSKSLLMAVAIGIVAFVIGIAIGQGMQSEQPVQEIQAQDTLPLERDLLLNPIITQWRAAVEGSVVEANNEFIVLENNGATIRIEQPERPGGAPIYNLDQQAATGTARVLIQDVTPGMRLQGDFFIAGPIGNQQYVASSFGVLP